MATVELDEDTDDIYQEGYDEGYNMGQLEADESFSKEVRETLEEFVDAIRKDDREHARTVIQRLLKEVRSNAILGSLW